MAKEKNHTTLEMATMKEKPVVARGNSILPDGTLWARRQHVAPDEHFEIAISSPRYFGEAVHYLHQGDCIEIMAASGSRMAECRVIGVNRMTRSIELQLIHLTEFKKSTVHQTDPATAFRIEAAPGGFGRYRLLRVKDGHVLEDNLSWDQALEHRNNAAASARAA